MLTINGRTDPGDYNPINSPEASRSGKLKTRTQDRFFFLARLDKVQEELLYYRRRRR